jgi:hypothetical protein
LTNASCRIVRSQFAVTHAPFEIPQENAVVLQQDLERRPRLIRR